ncbi:MAG: response regulator transcription factor [Pseudomonadota bacterium]
MGPNTVLVVEDEARIREELARLLREAGFITELAGSLRDAAKALERPFDLVLLDLGLPDGDGLSLCKRLTAQHPSMPIVILTARDAVSQIVRGLDLGAADYIVKPCDPAELTARVRAALRRANPAPAAERLELDGLWADPSNYTAGTGAEVFELRRREFDLLYFLLQHPGRAWTRDQLLRHVWGEDFMGTTRTVDLCVRRLRARIEHNTNDPQWIKTIYGVGYRMRDAN